MKLSFPKKNIANALKKKRRRKDCSSLHKFIVYFFGSWCILSYFHTQQEEQAEENCCNLKDLREGPIGKMLVRKSGRVQLILGQVTLDVSLGTSCSFFQVCLQSLSASLSPYLCSYVNISRAFPFSHALLSTRNWSLLAQTEEQATCPYWELSNTKWFVLQTLRPCWRTLLDQGWIRLFSACMNFPCPSTTITSILYAFSVSAVKMRTYLNTVHRCHNIVMLWQRQINLRF